MTKSKDIYIYIAYYIMFYIIYILGPQKPHTIVIWKYYFPFKLLPLFLAIMWGNIHLDVREMLYYMRKDKERTAKLKKRFIVKNSMIFLIGSFFFIFIFPYIVLIFKEAGINILFLLSN